MEDQDAFITDVNLCFEPYDWFRKMVEDTVSISKDFSNYEIYIFLYYLYFIGVRYRGTQSWDTRMVTGNRNIMGFK